jgi:hypothetical protein
MKVKILGDSCEVGDKGSSCCSAPAAKAEVNLKTHWDEAYLNSPDNKLGWYESFPAETLCLVEKCNLSPDSVILNVGAGTTTLIEFLLLMGYKNIIATDISSASLNKLKNSLGDESGKVEYMVDDLTQPALLNKIAPVDLWIDRAVLHFFTRSEERDTYFELVRSKVKKGGFAIFAEYNLDGATKCAGLPIHRYSTDMLAGNLGNDFELVGNFDHLYFMPSGAERPYVYALFRKKYL